MMFRGASAVNLDSKGRIAIPTRYRAEILEQNAGQMVCTVDIRQPCLLLYPLKEWELVEQKLLALSNFDPNQRSLQRVMLGYATECELDSAGRILISGPLRHHAKLEKSLMLVGQLNKFEIWSDAEWQAQIEKDMALGASGQFALSEELKMLSL
ncbi:protein MraZ [Pasteurella canis]|uniref:Transcriptional regulator MraZ n=3 Tax=Pasteurella TaxID=745 RepID=A0A2X1XDT2_9PAST|nr:protein MraZ [Pasteurella canis]SPY32245.1 protein MraZ [Pasteurella canis]SPY32390.1 protein MraZ [Pasteurella canis]SUC10254.1 protein MraZ [Pasteurella canis]